MSDKTFITSEGIIVREEDLTPEQRAEMEELECEEFEPEYISEEDFARGEGFWIDEDGHWVPLDDEDDW